MARKTSSGDVVLSEEPMSQADFDAQEPCPECGGRPGYNPATGVQLLTGHTYNCPKRPQ